MKLSKRCLAMLLTLIMVLSVATGTVLAEDTAATGAASSGTTNTKGEFTKYKYSDYRADHDGDKVVYGKDDFKFGANENVVSSTDVEFTDEFETQDAENFKALGGIPGASVFAGEDSEISWEINIETEGYYAINVLYYTFQKYTYKNKVDQEGNPVVAESKKSDIERTLYIDGASPFAEANALMFPRTWKDEIEESTGANYRIDDYGNQLRTNAGEVFGWYDIDCRDSSGNCGPFLYFYFTPGKHTITFIAQREAVVLNRFRIYVPEELDDYQTYLNKKLEAGAKYPSDANVSADDVVVKVQAEQPYLKSSTTLYAEYDRTTPMMEPYSSDQIMLNEIDGGKFTSPYQWLTWKLNVKEAGLYRIVTRFQQSSKDGTFCSRTLYINGEIPCEDARNIRFEYDSNWQVQSFKTASKDGKEGEEMYFYLNEGENLITLEVTLGEFADVLDDVDSIIYSLNQCYREILMITGSSPDTYRDYQFKTTIPDTLKELARCSTEIKSVVKNIEDLVGESGSYTSSFKTLVQDIDTMTADPRSIAKRLQNFKSNLGTISTWLLNATAQPVSMDWVMVAPQGTELPEAKAGFFAMLKHHFMMFVASFYVNYDDIGRMDGNFAEDAVPIEVWVTTSLDQSQIVRTLINNELQKSYPGLKVNLRLVAGGTVLPSIAAGTGPDIVLGVGGSDPLNYAIRGAVLDVSGINPEQYAKMKVRFNENAVIPYTYKGKVYGVPETFTFPMLFYRKDVLAELNLPEPSINTTWTDVYNYIIKLNQNSMMFGIPSAISTYGTLLYQNGLKFYSEPDENGEVKSVLAQPQSIKQFEKWTEFFTAYGCLVTYDFANRFRTGETPIGIADYTAYNQLSVFAPEIRGLWGFTYVPGTERKDESGNSYIDHQTLAGGSASIILSSSEHPQEALNFLDWWTSTEIQVKYGQEIESILGTASRYATANLEAASRLPWKTEDFKAIEAAWQYATALPEYPGSYIFGRYINFAFLEVVNNDGDPGEQLIDYVKMINDELERKQAEFAQVGK